MHMLMRVVLAGILAAASLGAAAQNYPSRPVKMIVPQPPGGGTDIIARTIGDALGRATGQNFLVENRPGAGTVVGTEAAAKAPADGYTLLVGLVANMAINPSLFARLPYDPVKDFTAVSMLADYPFLVVVNNELPVKTIADLIALAKSKPGQINFASAGNGTGQHLSTELFKMLAGVNMQHVPYRGAQAAYPELMAGSVPVFFDNISSALPQVKAGKVRAIAITSAARSPAVPDIPTIAESGVPGYAYHTWFGLWAPAATPAAIVDKLHAEVQKALQQPEVRDRIAAQAGQPSTMKRAEIDPFVKDEVAKWAKVVAAAGVKVE
ncbi:MAG: tripartite tricarboxylate transporter substrate binding protein [Rhodospirillales bacterium]